MTTMESREYGVGSRDYLRRAKDLLAQGTPAALFHAAFELRCGIEARLQEYRDAATKVAKLKKRYNPKVWKRGTGK